MRVIRQVHRAPAPEVEREPVVLTIGNFDGLHRGHAVLIKKVCEIASDLKMRSALLSFAPSPSQFFGGKKNIGVILPWRDRLALLRSIGMDDVHLLRFDASLARCSAADFLGSVLCDRINARHIIVGDDFHFGHRRQGSPEWLMRHAPLRNVGVSCVSAQLDSGRRISSTWIREALRAGDVQTAERLLGRFYAVRSRVRQGDQRGRTWGFPTANLYPHEDPLVRGVFLVSVSLAGIECPIPGVANVGCRPTLEHPNAPVSVEVHLLEGLDWNLYGQRVTVNFLARCREERRFDSFEALRRQIEVDVAWARGVWPGYVKRGGSDVGLS